MDYFAIGGIVAAGAVVAACWNYIVGIWRQISSRLILSFVCNDVAAHAVMAYCLNHCKSNTLLPRHYSGFITFVRPLGRTAPVIVEKLGDHGKLYWIGWVPLWVARQSDSESNKNQLSVYRPVTVTTIRGLLDQDKFLLEAYDYIQQKLQDCGAESRYRVYYHHGTAGKDVYMAENSQPLGDSSNSLQVEMLGWRFLGWRAADLGPQLQKDGAALDLLALSPRAERFIAQTRRWLQSREWFISRGLPWKYGALLYGEPGTGKTALVRALGEDLGLPVHVFDLNTFRNEELRSQWSGVLTSTPCIVLIEDIDGVFKGRDPVRPDARLTFDCLLNCLDGVERANGLLTIITTNNPDLLDPALGGGSDLDLDQDLASRPGRVDVCLAFHRLDAAGRNKIAYRILRDWPEEARQLVEAGAGDTGAQFERRCCEKAQQLFLQCSSSAEQGQAEPPRCSLDLGSIYTRVTGEGY